MPLTVLSDELDMRACTSPPKQALLVNQKGHSAGFILRVPVTTQRGDVTPICPGKHSISSLTGRISSTMPQLRTLGSCKRICTPFHGSFSSVPVVSKNVSLSNIEYMTFLILSVNYSLIANTKGKKNQLSVCVSPDKD